MKHFSDLYALDKRDWRGRPVVEDAVPVDNCANSGGNKIHMHTWVADCILHKGIGGFISSFKGLFQWYCRLLIDDAHLCFCDIYVGFTVIYT